MAARRGGRVAGVEVTAGEGGRVHFVWVCGAVSFSPCHPDKEGHEEESSDYFHIVWVAGYFDAPTIRTARNPRNQYFLFVLFFFWAGSHKCE
jgi:hypothetical protein